MKKIKTKMKIPNLLILLLFISGMCLALYPVISNIYMTQTHTAKIEQYYARVKSLPQKKINELDHAMQAINKRHSTPVSDDPFKKNTDNKTVHHKSSSLSALTNTLGPVLGIIDAPKANIYLPIYNGTSTIQLQKGAGLLAGTSLPNGGRGNHSVITGHRGLPKAKLFTDLPRLKNGDHFYIHVLGKIHEYKVDQIKVVVPTDKRDLNRVPNKDYVTLLTCTPYMINTHRLLVRGHRIPYNPEDRHLDDSKAHQTWMLQLILGVILGIIIVLVLKYWRRKNKR